jgi:hypothetical protein
MFRDRTETAHNIARAAKQSGYARDALRVLRRRAAGSEDRCDFLWPLHSKATFAHDASVKCQPCRSFSWIAGAQVC